MSSMWRTCGWVLLGSALILALSLGVRHGFGLFLPPMSAQFGWGREVFAFAIALQNLIWGLAQPFTGALADRFGLSLGFHAIDQDTYVAIVHTYAADHGLPFDAAEAINWATRRGSRSGRIAWHYVVDLAGRAGKAIG